jgi:hypothetical protein
MYMEVTNTSLVINSPVHHKFLSIYFIKCNKCILPLLASVKVYRSKDDIMWPSEVRTNITCIASETGK